MNTMQEVIWKEGQRIKRLYCKGARVYWSEVHLCLELAGKYGVKEEIEKELQGVVPWVKKEKGKEWVVVGKEIP